MAPFHLMLLYPISTKKQRRSGGHATRGRYPGSYVREITRGSHKHDDSAELTYHMPWKGGDYRYALPSPTASTWLIQLRRCICWESRVVFELKSRQSRAVQKMDPKGSVPVARLPWTGTICRRPKRSKRKEDNGSGAPTRVNRVLGGSWSSWDESGTPVQSRDDSAVTPT